MALEIEYFHERVLAEVQCWPVDVLADYARLIELLAEHGPNLRLPHSRASATGCSSFGLAVDRASGAPSTAFFLPSASWFCTRSSRSPRKRQTVN
jgi:hypothetical protein